MHYAGNTEKTANQLYIHKNTVSNKLKKIQGLVDIDFDDGTERNQVMFSYRLVIYYEKVLKEPLIT